MSSIIPQSLHVPKIHTINKVLRKLPNISKSNIVSLVSYSTVTKCSPYGWFHYEQLAQKHNFNGPTVGPKPHEGHAMSFEPDVMNAGQGIIGLQMGSNKFASQKGMVMGGVRHVADIRCDNINPESQKDINLQSGTNKFASQKGMVIGGVRHVADIRCDDMAQDSQGHIWLQSGSNQFANQKGMSFGAVRHVNDIRCDRICDEGKSVINLQYGYAEGANQSGMCFGKNRPILR